MPLAWPCCRANSRADYPQQGQVAMIGELLHQVHQGLPAETEVLVLADRGIGTSPALRLLMAGFWAWVATRCIGNEHAS